MSRNCEPNLPRHQVSESPALSAMVAAVAVVVVAAVVESPPDV